MYLVEVNTFYAASVTAASTIFRFLMGVSLLLAGPSIYQALGISWGNSGLRFIAVAFIPLLFLFYLYGHQIRKARGWKVMFWMNVGLHRLGHWVRLCDGIDHYG
jgi:hypothetical protein